MVHHTVLFIVCIVLTFRSSTATSQSLSSEYEFKQQLESLVTMYWNLDAEAQEICIAAEAQLGASSVSTSGWVAIGFSTSPGMTNARAMIGFKGSVKAYDIGSQKTLSSVVESPSNVQGDLTDTGMEIDSNTGHTVIRFCRKYVTATHTIDPLSPLYITDAFGSNNAALLGPHLSAAYSAITLSQPPNMCSPVCQYGGTCQSDNTCSCRSGWTGAGCTQLSSDAFDNAYTHSILLSENPLFRMWYTVNDTTPTPYLRVGIVANVKGYVAFGFSHSQLMIPAVAFIGSVNDTSGSTTVREFAITERSVGGVNAQAGTNAVTVHSGSQQNDVTRFEFSRPLYTAAYEIMNKHHPQGVIWALHPNIDLNPSLLTVAKHPTKAYRDSGTLSLKSGTYTPGITNKVLHTAHGVLMMLVFLLFLPAATLFTTSELKTRLDSWLRLHLTLVTIGVILFAVSFGLAVKFTNDENKEHFHNDHEKLGLFVTAAFGFQLLLGLFRVGTESSYRFTWLIFHRCIAAVVLLASWYTCYLGVQVLETGLERNWYVLMSLAVAFFIAVQVFIRCHSWRSKHQTQLEYQSHTEHADRANVTHHADVQAVELEETESL
jgi:DOMON domain/Eukaryotic cytochrome b561